MFEGLHPPEPDIFLMAEGVCTNMTEGSPLQGVTEKQLPNQRRKTPPKGDFEELYMKRYRVPSSSCENMLR